MLTKRGFAGDSRIFWLKTEIEETASPSLRNICVHAAPGSYPPQTVVKYLAENENHIIISTGNTSLKQYL